VLLHEEVFRAKMGFLSGCRGSFAVQNWPLVVLNSDAHRKAQHRLSTCDEVGNVPSSLGGVAGWRATIGKLQDLKNVHLYFMSSPTLSISSSVPPGFLAVWN